jgi:hypothetical protein
MWITYPKLHFQRAKTPQAESALTAKALSELVESLQSASNRETLAGAQRSRPAGVRTPRASSSWAMAASVDLPARRISAIPARVVALAFVACLDLAALAPSDSVRIVNLKRAREDG